MVLGLLDQGSETSQTHCEPQVGDLWTGSSIKAHSHTRTYSIISPHVVFWSSAILRTRLGSPGASSPTLTIGLPIRTFDISHHSRGHCRVAEPWSCPSWSDDLFLVQSVSETKVTPGQCPPHYPSFQGVFIIILRAFFVRPSSLFFIGRTHSFLL